MTEISSVKTEAAAINQEETEENCCCSAEFASNQSQQMKAAGAKFVGAHISAAGGAFNAFKNANAVCARSFALFLKNQRRWDSTPLSSGDISKFKDAQKRCDFKPSMILPHGSYLINLANPDDEKRTRSYNSFIDDLERCHQLGIPLYNFHPGSTVGACTIQQSVKLIAECINRAHHAVPEVCVVLETMAGQGNTVGNKFEDLRDIINLVEDKDRIGVCIDTCHIFAAGYDVRSPIAYEKTMTKFGDIVGFKYLKAVHLNDSKTPLGSGKDRHENIGKGHLGLSAFKNFMNDPRFDNIPMVLETPVPSGKEDCSVYKSEIDLLYSLIE